MPANHWNTVNVDIVRERVVVDETDRSHLDSLIIHDLAKREFSPITSTIDQHRLAGDAHLPPHRFQ